ncbi:hypothetical protein JW905_16805 [bacterium]|nr:hypothetical protein [candidate division CSSED10-310 bacterium]
MRKLPLIILFWICTTIPLLGSSQVPERLAVQFFIGVDQVFWWHPEDKRLQLPANIELAVENPRSTLIDDTLAALSEMEAYDRYEFFGAVELPLHQGAAVPCMIKAEHTDLQATFTTVRLGDRSTEIGVALRREGITLYETSILVRTGAQAFIGTPLDQHRGMIILLRVPVRAEPYHPPWECAPTLNRRVNPALTALETGTGTEPCVLQLLVDRAGAVIDCIVLRCSGDQAATAARDAVRQWLFTMSDGCPRTTITNTVITFR